MYTEINLASLAALQEGELGAFPTSNEGPPVLLARYEGMYQAFAAHCPHYGAPLEKGKIVEGRIVCPWHHACFRVADGGLCEPPALDNLPTFPVREADGRVWVTLYSNPPASVGDAEATPTAEVGGLAPHLVAATHVDERVFVLVGAGAAGEFAAQTLREEGFTGRLIMLTADEHAPYDRTKLSKGYLAGKAKPENLPLRQPGFYEQYRIELLTRARVTGLDRDKQEIQLENQPPVFFDKLLLAPGGTPRSLGALPGKELPGVQLLRTQADADALRQVAEKARQVVIVGASFIGMEVASNLVSAERRVTVVAQGKEPFERVLGPKIGAMFRALHQEHGVAFAAGAEVAELVGDKAGVTGVRLKTGQLLPADLVVLGVGVRPATDFLQSAFTLEKDGGLRVDEHLQAAPGIYAAGDIARFPLAATGSPTRIEHWRLAQQQGRVAALNMLGRQEKYNAAPFFWTQQYGKSLRYAGHAEQWDDILYHGEVAKQDFLALYVHKNQIVAAATMNRDADMIFIEALFTLRKMPKPSEV
ncbi:MAG TPA: FAD-dependent oxidoreductase, partial [Hymenobacter sp.]